MSTKRMLCTVLIAITVILAVVGGTVRARPSSVTTSVAADPHLSGEIAISALDNQQYSPAIAYNWKHNEYLIVWENVWGGGGHDIYAQRISDTGEIMSWFSVTSGSFNRMQPDVAYDSVNDRYLVVWIYDVIGDGSDWDVYGRFIPWNGDDPTPTEFPICEWTSSQWKPRVAYGRAMEEYLVVWMNAPTSVPTYISARRITAVDGTFPAGGFTISSGSENRDFPDVAYNLARNEYLVTWDVDNSGTGLDIYAVRLEGNGNALGGGEFGIAGWSDDEERPAVAACNESDQYLVAWQSLQTGNHYDLYARYVNGDGSLDGGPLVVYDTSVHEGEADVSCNMSGKQFMVTWQQQYSNLSGPYGIWGRFAFSDKTMSDAFAIRGISAGEPNRWYPVVAGGYANYLAAWEHEREGTSYQDIHGRLISPYALFLPMITRN